MFLFPDGHNFGAELLWAILEPPKKSMESSGFPSSPTGGKLGLKKQVDQIQYTVDEHSATLAKHSQVCPYCCGEDVCIRSYSSGVFAQLLNSSSNDLSSQLTQLEEKMMEAMNAMKDELMKKVSGECTYPILIGCNGLVWKISSVAADVSQLQKQLNVQKGEQGILTQQVRFSAGPCAAQSAMKCFSPEQRHQPQTHGACRKSGGVEHGMPLAP